MKARFLQIADGLRGSYWFLPALMAFAAILLSGAMIWVDTHVGSGWMDGLPWLYAARPDGARQLLSAIGGSMITVAGTVFSVTIASVVFASGQYGPRLLSNFMSDRGNQITLGTFIATFVYCLLVLRTIRSAHEDGAGFVPNLALLMAVALALCSIAVLIFFIHHVPSKLHINSVIQGVGDRLLAGVGYRFPRCIGDPAEAHRAADEAPRSPEDATPIASRATGYVQVIDDEALLRHAKSHDLVVRLRRRPGDFVHPRSVLVEAWPAERCNEDAQAAIAGAFAVGSRRNALQDLTFLIDELVEIAARALSPGVNDALTAVTCLDWLGAALSELARRELPSPLRVDSEGALRVIAPPVTFESFMDRSFGALIQYCANDMIAALRMLHALEDISLACVDSAQRDLLGAYADRLQGVAESQLTGFNLERVQSRAADLRRALGAHR